MINTRKNGKKYDKLVKGEVALLQDAEIILGIVRNNMPEDPELCQEIQRALELIRRVKLEFAKPGDVDTEGQMTVTPRVQAINDSVPLPEG